MSSAFKQIYETSIKNPEEFWQKISEDVFWFKKPTQILNKDEPPFYKWFCDGVTNTCYNALDIHVDQGRGERTALIYDSPITGNKKKSASGINRRRNYPRYYMFFSFSYDAWFAMDILSNYIVGTI